MKRIHSMTTTQTTGVCEAVLPLTREWLLEQGAGDGRYGGAGGFADFNADQYIGSVQFSFTETDGRVVSGSLVWRLDHTFTATGDPEVQLDAVM